MHINGLLDVLGFFFIFVVFFLSSAPPVPPCTNVKLVVLLLSRCSPMVSSRLLTPGRMSIFWTLRWRTQQTFLPQLALTSWMSCTTWATCVGCRSCLTLPLQWTPDRIETEKQSVVATCRRTTSLLEVSIISTCPLLFHLHSSMWNQLSMSVAS